LAPSERPRLKMMLRPEDYRAVWAKIDRPGTLMAETGCNSLASFYKAYQECEEVALYPWCIFRFEHVWPGVAVLHGAFWSARALRAIEAYQRDLRVLMKQHDWHRVQALVPESAPVMKRLLERVGFQFEGTLRNAIRSSSMVLDGLMYSVIREDTHEWKQ
jgi:hypothetical protein